MSNFVIRRPIVAMVIAILTVIIGAIMVATLPVAQFPNIVPPEIQILATYVGADSQTLEQAVATPIEQQLNGVDNMNYMYSLNATGNSQTTLIANFDLKTDPNTDLILTQIREAQAASQLRLCSSPCIRRTARVIRDFWRTTRTSILAIQSRAPMESARLRCTERANMRCGCG